MFYNQDFNDYRLDKYNYVNNNYNQPNFTENANSKSLYDPYQGFIRGNMFPNLYNGYTDKNLDINPTSEQARMLTSLSALDFAAHDINLYLDLYPNDRDMIELFNKYTNEAKKVRDEYEKKYGPILVNNEDGKYPWDWNKSPWPWERSM